jgi:hypothetical protein
MQMQFESETAVPTIEVSDRDTCDVLHWFDVGLVDVDTPHWLPLEPDQAQPEVISLARRHDCPAAHDRNRSRVAPALAAC